VIRKGLATDVVRRKKAEAERFEGSRTQSQWINEVKADLGMEGYVLDGMIFSEWALPPTHDVMLGKPWFSHFNPVIDWQTHEVKLDDGLLDAYWLIEQDEHLFQIVEEAEAAGGTTCSDEECRRAFQHYDDDWSDEDGVLASLAASSVRQVIKSTPPSIDSSRPGICRLFP
jgi:hypothetical protein